MPSYELAQLHVNRPKGAWVGAGREAGRNGQAVVATKTGKLKNNSS